MQILAHRGYWNSEIQNNSSKALRLALEKGYGFESDVRDYLGEMVISHNIAASNSQKAEEVFQWLEEFKDERCFAINIKADGLKELLVEQFQKHNIKNYFVFDMSIPQTVEFADMGLNYFTRQSEYERELVLYETAKGVWIDGFVSDEWITEELVNSHLKNEKKVCLVSPELHKREYLDFWSRLRSWNIDFSQVMLCTDYPDQAAEFFESKLRRK